MYADYYYYYVYVLQVEVPHQIPIPPSLYWPSDAADCRKLETLLPSLGTLLN